MTLVHVVEAKYVGGFRVRLPFGDGLRGEVDLAEDLWGEVFEPLREPSYFAGFVVDDSLAWPNGAVLELYPRSLRWRRQRRGEHFARHPALPPRPAGAPSRSHAAAHPAAF